jgi:UrcA family protein
MIRKATISALLSASILTTPAPAEEPRGEPGAWPRLVTVSTTIEFRDLDLGTPGGVAEAHRRASRIIAEMCRPDPVPADQGRGRVDGHCFRQAMADARAQIGLAVAARDPNVRTALNRSVQGNSQD